MPQWAELVILGAGALILAIVGWCAATSTLRTRWNGSDGPNVPAMAGLALAGLLGATGVIASAIVWWAMPRLREGSTSIVAVAGVLLLVVAVILACALAWWIPKRAALPRD